MVKTGGIRLQWEPADPKVVPFQPSARPTSGISKVNGGRWERQGERLSLELWLDPVQRVMRHSRKWCWRERITYAENGDGD
jgi:hypothetical protein